MERGKGLQRKTPLKQGKPLESRTPLKQGKGLSSGGGLQRKTPLSQGKNAAQGNSTLRQGKGLARRSPLPRGKGLGPGAPPPQGERHLHMASASPPASRAPRKPPAKPLRSKPPKVTPEERHTRKIVPVRSGGVCEKCGCGYATDKAHRMSRGVGGPWGPANILDLCHDCHMHDHQEPEHAYQGGWHLRSHQDPATTPVLIHHEGHQGWARIDSHGAVHWTAAPPGGTL